MVSNEQIVYDLQDERWIKNIKQIKPSTNKVILTFDDGPSRQLPKILDILKEKNVPAVFFWQAKLLFSGRPWKRVLAEGHVIGSHAYNHKNLTKLSKEQQFQQIKYSIDKTEKITGVTVHYFSPPYGQYNEDTMEIINILGLTPVMWEIASFDWEKKRNPEEIITNVVDHVIDGSVILLHELEQTVQVLPEIIDGIRKKGLEFTLFNP